MILNQVDRCLIFPQPDQVLPHGYHSGECNAIGDYLPIAGARSVLAVAYPEELE